MIHAAVCDDESENGQRVYEITERCFQENGIRYQIQLFERGKDFWYEVEEGTFFDIVLLDIEMPELDGIELAKRIRKALPNVILIFVTSYRKYVYDVFSLEAFRFIPKDQIEQRLAPALSDALKRWKEEEGKCYIIENKRELERIPLKQIVSIWREGKYAVISKKNGEQAKVRKTLAQIYEELPHEDFEWIDRGSICNLSHILRVDGEKILLSDGSSLPVIRGRILELKARIRNYWVEKEGI